jgi:hypothetical protein
MGIAQSALHLTGKGEAPEKLDKYQPPVRKRGVNNGKAQRNAKGQFVKGHTCSMIWTEERAMELAKALLDWMKFDETNFLMKDFLFEHDLYSNIISDLSEKYPPFAEHIARAKEIEAHRIQKFALTNNLNSGMAQWVLAVNHKQHNVQKQEITGSNGTPLSSPTIVLQPVKAIAVKHSGDEN